MPYPVSTIGDEDNGNGVIIDGDPGVFVNGVPVATVGSTVQGFFGQYRIISGALTVFVNGKPKACVSSITNANTDIITGSPSIFVE